MKQVDNFDNLYYIYHLIICRLIYVTLCLPEFLPKNLIWKD